MIKLIRILPLTGRLAFERLEPNTLLVFPYAGEIEDPEEAEEHEKFRSRAWGGSVPLQEAYIFNSSNYDESFPNGHWWIVEDDTNKTTPAPVNGRIVVKTMLLGDARKELSKDSVFLLKSNPKWDNTSIFYCDTRGENKTKDINQGKVFNLSECKDWSEDVLAILFTEKTKEQLEEEELAKHPMQVFFERMGTAEKKSSLKETVSNQLKEIFSHDCGMIGDIQIFEVAALAAYSSPIRKEIMDKIGVSKEFDRIVAAVKAEIITKCDTDANTSTVFSTLRDNVRFPR